ncbi:MULTISPECIES: hypothetical protein [unclassified Oceanobacillus]|uniref:hypothetical protein n=1 Tax=Oceanobacillus TaxID=182709 RepID=UPI001BEB57EC|nr:MULTISPECIES: hypothetical protein [unclassified Oceanobacillus]MBT2601426.1 hypothetical protein [Oceanobacillus sp. ISL-74]MBT2653297.1 hypothetical protein [Oceanobacillus sp. ISL-73]
MTFIMQLDLDTLVDLIGKAQEKDFEETIWQKWLVDIQNMDKESFVPFDKYKEQHMKVQQKEIRSEKEVLEDAENILKSMSR